MTNQDVRVRVPWRHCVPGGLPVARDLSFDALHVRANRRARAGAVWYDAFALADGRIVVCSGDLGRSAADDPATPVQQLREIFLAGLIDTECAGLLAATHALLCSGSRAEGASAIVGVIDRAGQTFSYITVGQLVPFIRYHDGTVAALPPGISGPNDGDEPYPPAQTVVDLRDAAFLLLYTDGLVRATRTINVGLRRLGRILDDDRLLHCTSPTAWLARRMLDDRSHAEVALLAVTFASRPAAASSGRVPRWTVSWTFEATALASHAARRAFLDCLTSKNNGGRPADLAAAELVFGELLGNVARHAPGIVEARLDWTAEAPVLHVLDNGAGYASRRACERLPVDEMSENGRGLFIIDAFATNFSIRKREHGGTHATATLALLTE